MTQRFFKMMSMNSNKRKGRMNPNSGKLGRSKFYSEKSMSCDGIYGNSKVMYAGASLVGCVVQVQVQNGAIYEGVLRTFSHQLDIVLETAHKVGPQCGAGACRGISPTVSNLIASYPFEGGIHDKIIFRLSDIIMMQACNVDVDYAVKDNFTDTAISKFNGQVKERELEPWEGTGSDSETTVALSMDDEDGTNGWDANDMFRTNAEKYGVKSSYDNSLQEYTVPLTKKDTEEYKLQEARALKIAQEIETNSSYQSRIQLENGDEEDRFSAVVRPQDEPPASQPSKYVLPQKRRNAPGLKRQTSTTTSPVHQSGGKASYSVTTQSSIPSQAKQYPVTDASHNASGPFPSATPPPVCGATNAATPMVPSTGSKSGASMKMPVVEEAPVPEMPKLPTESLSLENIPKVQVLCPPPPQQTLPPRIERRRENEKKFAKQKGRMDEIEDFKKFSKNFNVLTEEKEPSEVEEVPPRSDPATTSLVGKMERVKVDQEEADKSTSNVVKFSTLNPNAKEFVFNPNAKAFTPRSVSSAPPPMPVQAPPPPPLQRVQEQQGPMMAVSPSQMIPQPIFTAMGPQYVMQAPVSVALTSPFATASQTPRFRKATGQPILAPAAIPTPSQLTVQYTSPPGVIHASAPPQATVGYPQMNFVVGPRVVSPQPVGMIPTSHSVSYCDTSHLPTHLIMSAHSAASAPHSLQQQGGQHSNHHHHHPPQSQTPVIHPAPSPVHQVPAHSQPPPPHTPTTVMYPGGGALAQHQLQTHHAHSQQMGHPIHQHHHHHHPGFPGGAQPLVLMQQQQQQQPSHHGHHHHSLHHHHHMHPGGGHLLPQMAIIPTSAAMTTAPTSIATPPYAQQHQ